MRNPTKYSNAVVTRFWQYVWRRQDHQCWPWKGSLNLKHKYGQLKDKNRVLKTHRLAWELHFGAIPNGLLIRHLCHNPSCCNPIHLLPGTAKDNHDDMRKAHRMVVPKPMRGANNHQAILTDADVISIRQSNAKGVDLANKFNVSPSLISKIRSNKAWKHLL